MNNGDREMIIRLEERIISMQSNLKEIKNDIGGIQGCINDNDAAIIKTRTILDNHLAQGKHGWVKTAVAVSIISLIVSIIFKLLAS